MKHGLSKCKYIYNGSVEDMPGAVSVELTPKSSAKFENRINGGGNQIRYENTGYDGRLELAALPVNFIRDIFGWDISADGTVTEKYSNTGTVKEFCIMYQIKGRPTREILRCVTADKPEIKYETDSKSIKLQTAVLTIYARRDEQKRIRSFTDNTESNDYKTWFGYIP